MVISGLLSAEYPMISVCPPPPHVRATGRPTTRDPTPTGYSCNNAAVQQHENLEIDHYGA